VSKYNKRKEVVYMAILTKDNVSSLSARISRTLIGKPHRRDEMIAFLKNHFRYDTMNSWNLSTSYAATVKLYKLDWPSNDLEARAYDFLDIEEAYFGIKRLFSAFAKSHDYRWQANFNGRSSGYIVLYQGKREATDYKTRCDVCGRLTWYATEQACKVSGCNGTLLLLEEPAYQISVFPGKSTDENEDFTEWEGYDLAQRVGLVWEFDELVRACEKEFITFVTNHGVVEKEILVPRTVRVARPVVKRGLTHSITKP
jgi:hypothetical protein